MEIEGIEWTVILVAVSEILATYSLQLSSHFIGIVVGL